MTGNMFSRAARGPRPRRFMPARKQSGPAPRESATGESAGGHTVRDLRRVSARGRLQKNQAGLCGRPSLCGADSAPADVEWARAQGLGRNAVNEQQETARAWFQKTGLLRALHQLRLAHYHAGFRLVPEEPGGAEPLRAWFRSRAAVLNRLGREVWWDFGALDSACVIWREESGRPRRPIVFKPEKTVYKNPMGEESLWVRSGWSAEEFDTKKFSAATIRRWSQAGPFKLEESRGEHFRVLTRAAPGDGYERPGVVEAAARTLAQNESLEVGDNLSAFLGRSVMRQVLVGHEIKQGPFAGRPLHFWNSKIDERWQELFGRTGILEVTTNFDQEVKYPYPDMDRFKAEKYQSVFDRLALWFGPLGLLYAQGMLGKTLNPNLAGLLRTEAHAERELVRPFLEEIISRCFAPPAPFRIVWSDHVFLDSRARLELLKMAVSNGSASQAALLDELDLDQETEWQRKDREHAQPAHRTRPIYDPAHDSTQSNPGGRPAGTRDAGARVQLNGAHEAG